MDIKEQLIQKQELLKRKISEEKSSKPPILSPLKYINPMPKSQYASPIKQYKRNQHPETSMTYSSDIHNYINNKRNIVKSRTPNEFCVNYGIMSAMKRYEKYINEAKVNEEKLYEGIQKDIEQWNATSYFKKVQQKTKLVSAYELIKAQIKEKVY